MNPTAANPVSTTTYAEQSTMAIWMAVGTQYPAGDYGQESPAEIHENYTRVALLL